MILQTFFWELLISLSTENLFLKMPSKINQNAKALKKLICEILN